MLFLQGTTEASTCFEKGQILPESDGTVTNSPGTSERVAVRVVEATPITASRAAKTYLVTLTPTPGLRAAAIVLDELDTPATPSNVELIKVMHAGLRDDDDDGIKRAIAAGDLIDARGGDTPYPQPLSRSDDTSNDAARSSLRFGGRVSLPGLCGHALRGRG